MAFPTWQSLPAMFFAQARQLGSQPFLWCKRAGTWESLSYADTAGQVRRVARSLQALGVAPGDRVALVAENRPEWTIADMAIMAIGAITVPAFATNTTADHRHVLSHSGAKGVIISTKAIAERVLPAALEAHDLAFVITMEELPIAQRIAKRLVNWRDLLEAGAGRPDDLDEMVARLQRSDTCCFIYTSGTGGTPKAVMLTHGSILCNCLGAWHLLKDIGIGNDVFLCFLPLSHAYEHTVGQFFPMTVGAQIYFAESVEKLTDNMVEVKPTIMTAVPRLYEAMHQRILRGLARTTPFQRHMFNLALSLGRRRLDGQRLGPVERLLDLAAEVLVRRKLRQRFGGRLKAFVSGGAALNEEIGLFFLALGLRLLQGYGQTEASPVVSANPPRKIKIRTVGPALEAVEIRIAADGEILIRSEAVMKGYWRDEAATSATIRDGWLHTGDIGVLDSEGYLQITDRKKDIIVLSGGDNVSPARVEGFLVLQPEINQAMVYGDKHTHVVALLVPDEEFVKNWARREGGSPDLARLAEDAAFQRAFAPAIERVNAGLSLIERVRRYTIAAEPFTMENAMLTVSMKIRRHKIMERYGAALERLYK
ncbi:MAG TPA: long-chain fatty acid--CoA ligase [Candidatus Polarisedimenticolia bacterium]|nr:long-chain fatty acid--CoA ligase [Dongiaceae bacterium]HYV88000.1 long-chain fatty acid--CoA ligase [Candidatus Polarisedimenticolia bacterium]